MSLVNSSPSPLKVEIQIVMIFFVCRLHHNMTGLEIFFNRTSQLFTTCKNHRAWPHPSVSLTKDCCQSQLDPLESALERSCVPRFFFSYFHSLIFFISFSFFFSFILLLFFIFTLFIIIIFFPMVPVIS